MESCLEAVRLEDEYLASAQYAADELYWAERFARAPARLPLRPSTANSLAPLRAQHMLAPLASPELAAYTGLHAFAATGDSAGIARLARADNLEARDGNGRTPLHVATFQKQRDAVRALIALRLWARALLRF
mgnify:CR=1 FL=1